MQPSRRLRIVVVTAIGVLLITAVEAVSQGIDLDLPRAWIDAPRAGTSYEVGDSVEIVAHVGLPAGPGSVVVTVDGVAIDTLALGGGASLDTVRLNWTADGSGARTIGVRPEGARVVGATVDITVVGEEGGPSTTVPPTTSPPTIDPPTTSPPTTSPPTTSPPTTSPPTTSPPTSVAPCVPQAPSPSNPSNGAAVTSVATTLSWTYSGCTPVQFEVVVTGESPGPSIVPIQIVVASATVSSTSWTTPALSPCEQYQWRVRAIGSGGASAWSATWSYDILGRSC